MGPLLGSSNAGTAPPGWALRLLVACRGHSSLLLAASLFGGLLVPPLAHACRLILTPLVVGMMLFVLLRVDMAGMVLHLRRPLRVGLISGVVLILSPLLTGGLLHVLPLDPALVTAGVLFAASAAATNTPAFARIVGLDAELCLLVSLLTTMVMPVTAPLFAEWLGGTALTIGAAGFMLRLALVVFVPLIAAALLRSAAGSERLTRAGPVLEAVTLLLLVLFAFGVTDGLMQRLMQEPGWAVSGIVLAFVLSAGLNAANALIFAAAGRDIAAASGYLAGTRNTAIYLAALPAGADPHIALFVVFCQFPMYLSPALLRPLYRRVLR